MRNNMPVGSVGCIKCGAGTLTLLCADCMDKEQAVLRAFACAQAPDKDFPKCSKCGEESWHEPCDYCYIKEEDKMADKAKTEQVDHPKHYNHGKFEVIDVIEDWELDFHIGNVVKYVSRAGRKSDDTEIQDLKKALWYLKRRIEILEKKDV